MAPMQLTRRLMNDMHHSGLKYRLHYHRLFIVRWFTRHSKDDAQYNNTQIESLCGSLIHHACIFSLSLWAWINMTLGPTQEQSKKGRTTFKPNTKKDLSGGFQHLYVAQLGRNILGKIRLLLCLPVPPPAPPFLFILLENLCFDAVTYSHTYTHNPCRIHRLLLNQLQQYTARVRGK